MTPDSSGRFRGISVPRIPWKKTATPTGDYQLTVTHDELNLIADALQDYREGTEEDVLEEEPWLDELLSAVEAKIHKIQYENKTYK